MREKIEVTDFVTGEAVEAEIFDDVAVEHFLEAQVEWRPVVVEARRKLAATGEQHLIPRHAHWDWTNKEEDLKLLAYTFYGLSCGGKLQGLMKLQTVGHRCRLPEQLGKALVYVDYVETAPWNIKLLMKALGREPQYAPIGSVLIRAAVRKSIEEGVKGRLGLHSLPSSERFYLHACGMKGVERDPAKQNLLWCEFTPEGADKFLAGGTL